MCLLYDSGARVQEFIDLKVRNIRISSPATVTLTGKGRKTRQVPLMKETGLRSICEKIAVKLTVAKYMMENRVL